MEVMRADTMVRLIKTKLAVLPYNNDEQELFDGIRFEDVEHLVRHLLNRFQSNPLFTPEYSAAHPEIPLSLNYIAANPSWSASLIVRHAMETELTDVRRTVLLHILRARDDCTAEHLRVIDVHDPPLTIRPGSTSRFDELVDIVTKQGGFDKSMWRSRVLEDVMRNPNLPVDTIINLAVATGVPNAAVDWVKNPFYLVLSDPDRAMYPFTWFTNESPENLRNLLGLVRCAREHITECIREDPVKYVYFVYNSLEEMVSSNPVWDPEMESEFGCVVWPLLEDCLRMMYQTRGVFRTRKEFSQFRIYLHHRNPSWCISKQMREYYNHCELRPEFTRTIQDDPYSIQCSDMLCSLTDSTFKHYYVNGVTKKKTLCIRDICEIMDSDTVESYVLEQIAEYSELRGEPAKKIVSFLYKHWIIPKRRERATRRVHTVLKKVSKVSKYSYAVRMIASFLTE